ncbi:hypothetical protein N657DRAFT_477475 [Parathielavia appendiculata]|uniref:Uncharacterized protein n=1 Tax=Parathielavia appendiculata TaxID=2587402 RepID=A0AAN6Z2N1_9PEZI|nr:hypothetical protein N657DRAFT_477475 [Parathielavia appendiculata]
MVRRSPRGNPPQGSSRFVRKPALRKPKRVRRRSLASMQPHGTRKSPRNRGC